MRLAPAALLFSLAAVIARPQISAATPALASADTLRGTVSDPKGQPIAGASVTIPELGRYVVTGADGGFAVADVILPRFSIVVRRVGYASIFKAISGASPPRLSLTLTPTALHLEPVTVTATRSSIDPLSSPLPTSALSGELLRREHEVSLAHALDRLAGVRTLSTGAQVGKPMLRGLTGPRVLVLDNGLRLEDYSWSDEDGPSVDSRMAERVEVIRGPASVLYGSDAIGGVINVVGNDVPDARGQHAFARGAADIYGGTNNKEIGGSLRMEGASGAFGWRASGIGRHAGNIHTPTGNEETPTGDIFDTGYHAINGELAVGVHGEKASAGLRYERYGGDFQILDGPPVEDDNVSGPLRRLSDNRIQGTTSWQLGAARLETRSQWQRHSLQELVGDSRVGDDTPSFDLLLNTYTTDVLFHHAGASWLSGTIGISGLYQDNTSTGVFPLVPDARTTNGALFAFEQGTFGRWSILVGARGDAHHISADANGDLALASQTRSTSAFSGDLGVVFRPVSGFALAGNVGRAFRSPTLFELFTNGPHLGEDRFEIGLPSAKPETSLNLDLSARWELGRFRGEVAAYRNRIDHFIFIQANGDTASVMQDDGTTADLPVFQFEQTSRGVLRGVDVSAELAALPVLTLRGRFDMVRGTDESTDAPLPQIPPDRADFEAELHTMGEHPAHRLYLSVGTQIVAAQNRLSEFDTPTGGYALLHLGAGAAHIVSGRQFYLDIQAHNVTNKRYNDFLSRYKTFAYEQGRNVVVRVSTGF